MRPDPCGPVPRGALFKHSSKPWLSNFAAAKDRLHGNRPVSPGPSRQARSSEPFNLTPRAPPVNPSKLTAFPNSAGSAVRLTPSS